MCMAVAGRGVRLVCMAVAGRGVRLVCMAVAGRGVKAGVLWVSPCTRVRAPINSKPKPQCVRRPSALAARYMQVHHPCVVTHRHHHLHVCGRGGRPSARALETCVRLGLTLTTTRSKNPNNRLGLTLTTKKVGATKP